MENSENRASLARDPVCLKELLAVLGEKSMLPSYSCKASCKLHSLFPLSFYFTNQDMKGRKKRSSGLHLTQAFKSPALPSGEVFDKGEQLSGMGERG